MIIRVASLRFHFPCHFRVTSRLSSLLAVNRLKPVSSWRRCWPNDIVVIANMNERKTPWITEYPGGRPVLESKLLMDQGRSKNGAVCINFKNRPQIEDARGHFCGCLWRRTCVAECMVLNNRGLKALWGVHQYRVIVTYSRVDQNDNSLLKSLSFERRERRKEERVDASSTITWERVVNELWFKDASSVAGSLPMITKKNRLRDL